MIFSTKESLPKSGLLCPKCGLGVAEVELVDHEHGIHKYCIANGLRNGFYKTYDDWVTACKWNYRSMLFFFTHILE